MAFLALMAHIVVLCTVASTTGRLLRYLTLTTLAMTATIVPFCSFAALIMYALVIFSNIRLYL